MRALLVVVAFAGIACNSEESTSTRLSDSKAAVARTMAKALAHQAYPQWAMDPANSGRCPTVEDLGEYVNQRRLLDPWGRRYTVHCAPDLPAGVVGIAVSSPGEDGREGTGDDIRSWE